MPFQILKVLLVDKRPLEHEALHELLGDAPAGIDMALVDLRPRTGLAEHGALSPEVAESRERALAEVARRVLDLGLSDPVAALQQALLCEALLRTGNNKSGAARLLGIHRKAIDRMIALPR